MTANRPFTKTQRLAIERLGKRSLELNETPNWLFDLRAEIPAAWATLEQDIDVEEPKEKITIRLDKSVVQFYRAMGRGYQERMNRVLATYAQMKIARVMELDAAYAEFRGRLRQGVSMEEALRSDKKK